MTALVGAILAIAFGTAIALRLLSGGGSSQAANAIVRGAIAVAAAWWLACAIGGGS